MYNFCYLYVISFTVPCLFAPKGQKSIDRGKKSSRFGEGVHMRARKWLQRRNFLIWGRNFQWGRISPFLGEKVSKLIIVHLMMFKRSLYKAKEHAPLGASFLLWRRMANFSHDLTQILHKIFAILCHLSPLVSPLCSFTKLNAITCCMKLRCVISLVCAL